jgi:hypothetical protein
MISFSASLECQYTVNGAVGSMWWSSCELALQLETSSWTTGTAVLSDAPLVTVEPGCEGEGEETHRDSDIVIALDRDKSFRQSAAARGDSPGVAGIG